MAKSRGAPSRSGAASFALDVQPLFAEAMKCHQARRLAEAIAFYERILGLRPDWAEVHCNLGAALADLGRLAAAELAYRRAIALKPGFAGAHNNLGNLLKR